MNRRIKIATRGSALALWQANRVSSLLGEKGVETELVVIKTSGDKIQNRPLMEIGGKGLFVKEIQEALLEKSADIAVHSLKDYPVENPGELHLACIPEREDVRDALVLPLASKNSGVGDRPRVGTGSLRRQYQLAMIRPGWEIMPLRGNVDTRIRKVESGEYDAVVLASAGLKRLGKAEHIAASFSREEMVPAVGQGAIAIEARKDDAELNGLLLGLEDPRARMEIDAERKFLRNLHGSCTTPLGVSAAVGEKEATVYAFLSSFDGSSRIREDIAGDRNDLARMVEDLFESFMRQGAGKLIGT